MATSNTANSVEQNVIQTSQRKYTRLKNGRKDKENKKGWKLGKVGHHVVLIIEQRKPQYKFSFIKMFRYRYGSPAPQLNAKRSDIHRYHKHHYLR